MQGIAGMMVSFCPLHYTIGDYLASKPTRKVGMILIPAFAESLDNVKSD